MANSRYRDLVEKGLPHPILLASTLASAAHQLNTYGIQRDITEREVRTLAWAIVLCEDLRNG